MRLAVSKLTPMRPSPTADFGAGAKTELGQTRLFGGIELDAGDRGAGAGLKIRETAERFCGSVVHHLRLVRV